MKPGLILYGYRKTNTKSLRGKFKDSESLIKNLSNSKIHQRDNTGRHDENLSINFNTFVDYFDVVSNHTSVLVQQRNEQQRRDVVTRTIIEQ